MQYCRENFKFHLIPKRHDFGVQERKVVCNIFTSCFSQQKRRFFFNYLIIQTKLIKKINLELILCLETYFLKEVIDESQ